MKFIIALLFTLTIWILLFRFFFEDFKDFKSSVKSWLGLGDIGLTIDYFTGSESDTDGFRVLIFLLIGVVPGFILCLIL